MHELMERLDVMERKDKVAGIVASMLFALVLLIVLLWWFARAGLVVGIEEPEWKTIGIIGPGGMDYGTDLKGRKDVNNFFDPSETPANRPKVDNSSSETSTDAANNTASNNAAATGSLTQDHTPTNVTAPSGQQESTNDKPDPKATGTGKPTNDPKPSNNNGGGSDDGETDELGNHGDPRATVLNPNGLFAFGNGIGGTGGRMPLKTELTGYNIQAEEKIKFEITIDPSGDVIFVKPLYAMNPQLAEIGKKNIKNWKFSETDPSAGNLKTTVTINFRLK
jgi:hypothetical protein